MKRIHLTALLALFVAGLFLLLNPAEPTAQAVQPDRLARGSLLDRQQSAGDPDYDLTALRLVSKAVLLVKENYVDQKRIQPREMLVRALKGVEREVAEVLSQESPDQQQLTVQVGEQQQVFAIGDVDSLWDVIFKLREIFRFLDATLPTDSERPKVEYAAINGMLRTLDPHTILLNPDMYEEMKMSTQGEFGGLGIVISIRDGKLTVVAPIDGTPAHMAGIRRQDHIARIGEESTVNMGLEEAVKRLRGAPGTQVTIWVLRDKWQEPRKYVITRARIKIESVSSELLDGDVGYVRIKNFQRRTATDLDEHMQTMAAKTKSGLKGLVLDLRDNPGGLLDQAIEVSDRFIASGTIVSTVGAGPRKDEKAHWSGTKSDLPIAVLVNGGSASASEIVSGAIKNDGRGVVIGEQTFGKGSVQVLYEFTKTALKLTVAQYLTPGDLSIQNIGITPDIEIQPMHIDKKDIDLYRDSIMMREEDLDKHLVDQHIREQKPDFTLRYLAAKEDDDPDAVAVRNAENAFHSDFEIEFARKLLAKHGAAERSAILAKTGELIAHITAEQETNIIARLAELGVDWGIGDKAPGGNAVARVISSTEGEAGTPIPVTIEVENTGTAPLYRLRATTKSKAYAFSDLEFVFGKLMPGKKRSWTVPFSTRKGVRSRMDEVDVSFAEQYGRAPTPMKLRVKLRELPEPSFLMSAVYDDSKGNADGLLQQNETIDLVVAVHNQGPGTCQSALVAIQNKSGKKLFIQQGRATLKDLAPGTTQYATLRFDVHAEPDTELELQLSAFDAELGAVTSSILRPMVVAAGPAAQRQKGYVIAKTPVSLLAAAQSQAPQIATLSPGQAAPVLGKSGDFVRVQVDKKLAVFAPSASVKIRPAAKALRKKAGPQLNYELRPPELHVDPALIGSATDAERIEVHGTVDSTLPLRDLIAFVNGDKVHYAAFGHKPAKAQAFKFFVDLKEGPNLIQIAARVDDALEGRVDLVVHREEHDAQAVVTQPGTPKTGSGDQTDPRKGLGAPAH